MSTRAIEPDTILFGSQVPQNQEENTTERTTSKIFIIMRHADKEKHKKDPQITEKGKARAALAAQEIRQIAEVRGKSEIRLVASSLKRSQETAAVIANTLNITEKMVVDARIKERDYPFMTEKEKHANPQYQAYKNTQDEKVKFQMSPGPGAETCAEAFQRMVHGVEANLNLHDSSTLPVFVSHQAAMKALFQGKFFENELEGELATSFFNGSHYCEIFVVERKEGKFIALDRKKISPAKL
jgi:broad specificity phosphatase PhoE